MKKWICWIWVVLLGISASCPAFAAHTVAEVRERYQQIVRAEKLYADPDSGTLTEEAERNVLDYVRFMRWLAYVDDPIAVSEAYTKLAQDGALLLAAADTPAHVLPQPEGFPDELYETASAGIGGSNIASINWMDTDVLFAAVEHFQRDEGGYNRYSLGHRRWLLSPALQQTGFGMANAQSGMTYVTMYVHDFSAPSIEAWETIAWPSEGAFPAEYMYDQTPWSLLLSDDVYAPEQPQLRIIASCEQTGETFVMDRPAQEDAPDAYWLNTDGYGIGYALIFRPAAAEEFEQNQVWKIRVENLCCLDGSLQTIEYDVEMMSLKPAPVRLIELDYTELKLTSGDKTVLHADVIPQWADDISVSWSSSDETVATVDASGCVRAAGMGKCMITVRGANDQFAECVVTVE